MEIYNHTYLVLEVITGYLDDKKKNSVYIHLGSKENWKEMANPEKKKKQKNPYLPMHRKIDAFEL